GKHNACVTPSVSRRAGQMNCVQELIPDLPGGCREKSGVDGACPVSGNKSKGLDPPVQLFSSRPLLAFCLSTTPLDRAQITVWKALLPQEISLRNPSHPISRFPSCVKLKVSCGSCTPCRPTPAPLGLVLDRPLPSLCPRIG